MEKIKRLCPVLRTELDKVPYFNTGAVKGRSDLSAIKDGRISFIEVKNEVGRPTDEQLNFIKQMQTRYGCRAGIARSVEDAAVMVNEPPAVMAVLFTVASVPERSDVPMVDEAITFPF